jgi:hypothetical protein
MCKKPMTWISRIVLLTGLLCVSSSGFASGWQRTDEFDANSDQRVAYARMIKDFKDLTVNYNNSSTLITLPTFGSRPDLGEQDSDLVKFTLYDITGYSPGSETAPKVTLWYTTDNFYLRGFENTNGDLYQFDPEASGYDLAKALQSILPPSKVITLPFGSDYNTLSKVAGADRNTLQFSRQSMHNAIYTLAYAGINPQSTNQSIASAQLLMIQYFMEAPRFNDVYGYLGETLADDPNAPREGLPVWQQYMENRWAAMSDYMGRISKGPTPPLVVPGMGRSPDEKDVTFTSFNQAAAYIATMLYLPRVNDPQMGGITGDWGHAQL